MFYRLSIILSLLVFCLSCQQAQIASSDSSNKNAQEESIAPPDISPNENKGLKAVIAHYGGQGHFAKGSIAATAEKEKSTIFEIELSDSKLADKQKQAIPFTASNMAYLFFKELNKIERKKYDEIHSIVRLSDGTKTTTKFPVGDLELVLKKMNLLKKIVSILQKEDYAALSPMIKSTDLIPYNNEDFIKDLKKSKTEFGAIQSFKAFGFSRKKTIDGQRVLHLSGHLIRPKKNTEFSIGVAMDGDKEEVYTLQSVL